MSNTPQDAKARADELKKKHSQVDESGATIDSSDAGKTNPSDRGNAGDSKGRSQIDESGADVGQR